MTETAQVPAPAPASVPALGFICFYRDERFEVCADTRLQAQQKALAHFQQANPRRRLKPHEVTAHLAEKAGQPILHTPDF